MGDRALGNGTQCNAVTVDTEIGAKISDEYPVNKSFLVLDMSVINPCGILSWVFCIQCPLSRKPNFSGKF